MILFAFGTFASFGQFSLEGQYRPRTELRNGFKKPIHPGQDQAFFTEHRARFIAGFKAEKLGLKLSFQDVRIWGETGQINKSDQLLSVYEAYGEYFASEKSTFRIGRQELIYDGHRLFGNLDWAMQGRAFDAVRYMFKDSKGTQFELVVSWNQPGYGDALAEPARLVGNNYQIVTGGGVNPRIFNLALPKSQQMGYYKKTFKKGDIAINVLNDLFNANDSTSITYSNLSFGITPNFSIEKLKLGGQIYYTGGAAGKKYTPAAYETIRLNGFMLNAYVQHTGLKGAPMLGVDFLSGDDESTADVEGWAPKYGTNHKFYGYMDYFYVGNGHGGLDAKSAGLLDVYLKTSFKLNEKTSLQGDLHYFASAAERTNATNKVAYKGALGTELDLVATRTLTKGLTLMAGYSQMFGPTETLKQLKFGNPNQEIKGMQSWAWIMLSFSPKFL